MSSSKRDTPSSKTSPSVSFVLPIPDLPMTPYSLLSHTSSRRQTARSTLLKSAASSRMRNTNTNSVNNNETTPSGMDVPAGSGGAGDNSLMFLPPSQTINESLSALAISTSKQLEEVWDELGLSPEERADQLTDLLSSFRRLCQEKIESEQLVASNYRDTIVQYKEEIRTTSKALKMEVDESLLKDDSGLTLQDEIMTLEMKLEDLRSIAGVAIKELTQYRDELVDNHKALGLKLDETWLDISSDLTRDRILEFRDKVQEVDVSVQHRTSAIIQFLQGCQELIVVLKCDTEENSLDKKIMNSLVKGTDGNMTMVSKFESDTCTGIDDAALDTLKQRLSDLHSEKKRRKATLNEMGALIGELWEKLDIPKEEQKKFASSIDGLGMDTMQKGEKELARLREMKTALTGKFIHDAREKIKSLWEETNTPQNQRDQFDAIEVEDEDDFDEPLLIAHEKYVEELTLKQEKMHQIVNLIRKRESILDERMQYEAFLKDPERLKQRGAAFTQQLIKEEKMARRIKKGLPEYTERLEKRLTEWESEYDVEFIYNGEVYFEVMKRQDDEWMQYKENEMKLKLEKKQNQRYGPLSDTTNRSRAPSRMRAVSRGKTRDESSTNVQQNGGRDQSRGNGFLSRGKANATSRPRERPAKGASPFRKGLGLFRK